jgi:toxin CcdB
MAKFDVYRMAEGEYVVDCQSDFLANLNVRFCVPLLVPERAPLPARHLNPSFTVAGQAVIMVTQYASAVPVNQLRDKVSNLSRHDLEIGRALDFLLSGI